MDRKTVENLLIERVLAEYQALPKTTRYRFSQKFTKSIKQILRSDFSQTISRPIRFTKLVVLAAVMTLLMAMVVAGASMAHRMFTIKRMDNSGTITPIIVETTVGGNLSFEPEGLPYVPDGYVLTSSITTDVQHTEHYSHQNGARLVFDKSSLSLCVGQNNWLGIDADGPITEVLIDEIPVTQIEQSKYYYYLWTDDTSFYMLKISRTLDINTIHKVLEAIILK